MKKILIIVSILLLSGCFENSGYITKTCTKKDMANTLETTITYTFKFMIYFELIFVYGIR